MPENFLADVETVIHATKRKIRPRRTPRKLRIFPSTAPGPRFENGIFGLDIISSADFTGSVAKFVTRNTIRPA
jgi:hypothetical protein